MIQFASGLAGTIGLTSGQLTITDELTIDGPGADVLTVSGSGMSRIFLVTGTTVTIDDITISDGMATDTAVDAPELAPFANGGGLRNIGGNVTLNNVHVVRNTVQNFITSGGGVSGGYGASTTINGGLFADNQSIGLGIGVGGAIDFSEGSLTVNDTVFSGNKAIAVIGLNPDVTYSGLGGGGAIFGAANAHASITNSQFENNLAKGGDGIEGTGQDAGNSTGGAIFFGNFALLGAGPSTLNVASSSFSGNQSIGGKGADGPAGVRGGNGGPGFGGAIDLYGGVEATVTSSQFIGNHAITGDGGNGGAGADGGESGNYNNTFFGGSGGALIIVGGSLTVVDSSFSDNVVQGGNGGQGGVGGNGGHGSSPVGGAISVFTWDEGFTAPGLLNMTNTTVTNNTVIAGRGGAAGEGGAHDGDDGEAVGGGLGASSTTGKAGLVFVNVTGSTITGNTVQASSDAGVSGAGLLAGIGANVTLTNVDVSANQKVTDGVEAVVDGYACEGILTADGNCVAAQQGDANRDGRFDRADIDQVLQAGKYATAEHAVWGEGDWNNDGRFDQADIIAALQAGNYVA